MPLIKTIELPAGMGQHFFFDCGNGDSLAFFWFPDAPGGRTRHRLGTGGRPDQGDLTSAHGSMNHVAFNVDPADIDGYVDAPARRRRRVHRRGQPRRQRVGHQRRACTPGVFVRSVYFQDPDGILLEFAAWTRPLTEDDVRHEPRTAAAVADAEVAS